jgi:hypothetical protein
VKRRTIKLDSIESNWPMAQLISSGAIELERRGRWPLRYYVLVVRDPSPFEDVMTVWEGTEPTPRFRVKTGWTEGDDLITHDQAAHSAETERAADRRVGLLDRADPDALREIREHGHPEVHAEGLITERFYDEGGRAILKADPGKFRVVGVDTFASEDWVYAQYDDKQTAIECGTSHANDENGQPKKMLKVYVYDDKEQIHYEGGSR